MLGISDFDGFYIFNFWKPHTEIISDNWYADKYFSSVKWLMSECGGEQIIEWTLPLPVREKGEKSWSRLYPSHTRGPAQYTEAPNPYPSSYDISSHSLCSYSVGRKADAHSVPPVTLRNNRRDCSRWYSTPNSFWRYRFSCLFNQSRCRNLRYLRGWHYVQPSFRHVLRIRDFLWLQCIHRNRTSSQ